MSQLKPRYLQVSPGCRQRRVRALQLLSVCMLSVMREIEDYVLDNPITSISARAYDKSVEKFRVA